MIEHDAIKNTKDRLKTFKEVFSVTNGNFDKTILEGIPQVMLIQTVINSLLDEAKDDFIASYEDPNKMSDNDRKILNGYILFGFDNAIDFVKLVINTILDDAKKVNDDTR